MPGRKTRWIPKAEHTGVESIDKDRYDVRSVDIVLSSASYAAVLTSIAWNTEALSTPTKPYDLLDFEDETTVAGCKTFADRAVGGYSTANLDYVPANPSTNTPAHARFHGSISTKLPPNWRVERTGTFFTMKLYLFWL